MKQSWRIRCRLGDENVIQENSIIETLKSVGSIVGLITGAFVVFDRFIRNQPFLSFEPRESNDKSIELRVHNVADEGLLIQRIVVEPRQLAAFAFGENVRATIEAAASMHNDDSRIAFVPAQSTSLLPMIVYSEWNNCPEDTKLNVVVHWRPSSSRFFWTRPIKICRTVGELKGLEKATRLQSSIVRSK